MQDDREKTHPWWIKSVIIPVMLAGVVGFGGSWMAANEAMARYDERISELETKVERRPTEAQLGAAEDRSKAYTDAKFSEIMITLTELNATSKASAEDIREIKKDLRRLKMETK